MQDRDEQLMHLAAEALRTPAPQREEFLRRACQQDGDLYSEVSEIVAWEERMGGFMRDPLVGFIDLEELDRPFKPGQVVSERFEILREVGHGGMGVVYEAYDRKRQQRIAIKSAKVGFERLSPELKGALKVRHPNVCLVNEIHTISTDLGELDFLTMEFLDGETLLSRLSRGPLEPQESLLIARQLCTGLAEAHRVGVLHRDLKPANIILCREKNGATRAVITDFGLAADQDGNTDLIGGTPSYMAPELKESGKASPASDVYALGVLLCEMVTGQKPFAPPTDGNAAQPAPPRKVTMPLPGPWSSVVLPCLDPLPAKRPAAQEILAVLDRKPVYRRPWVAIAILIFLVLGLLLWRQIYNFVRPPDARLAMLPIEGAELLPSADGILHDVAQRLGPGLNGKLKVRLLSPAAVKDAKASSPEEAARLLQATHVLQLTLHRDNDAVAVDAAVIDTATQAHLHDYHGRFVGGDFQDLAGGLAGLVFTALHLPRPLQPEFSSQAAAAAYNNGLNDLRRDRYSYEVAITQFQQAIRQDAHSPAPVAGLADALVNKYNVERNRQSLDLAQNYLQAAAQMNPDSPEVLLASASLNIAAERYAQAIQDCVRVLELDPRNSEAWVRSGFAYEMQGAYDKAQQAYYNAIQFDPGYYKPHQYLGAFYYYSLGKYAEAEEQYRKEVEVENGPQKLNGYANLGGVLTAQGRYAEAEKVYRASLQIKETPTNLNNLGVTLADLGRDAEALPLYERAAELVPTNYIYWVNIGDSARRLGQAEKAGKAYVKLRDLTANQLQTNSSSKLARVFFAYALARLNHKDEARREIGQAMGFASDSQQIVLRAVLTYELLGDRELALTTAARASRDIKREIENHPDLAEFRQDSRFTKLVAEK